MYGRRSTISGHQKSSEQSGLRRPPASCLIAFFACAIGLPISAKADTLDDYLSLVTGSFDSSAQAASDERYDNAIWHTTEIWSQDLSYRWTYTENWLEGMDKPYRQRISRYALEDHGSITVESFEIPDPDRFIGAWKNPSLLSQVSAPELSSAGCTAQLARTGPNRFEGGTTGQTCRNQYRDASYLVSRSLADEHGVHNWDRGFDQQGNQVWGPVAGPYRFRRLGQEICAKPVLMLVYGEIFDRAAFGSYIRALGESGLYPQSQAYYRAFSPAIDNFEGNTPPERGVVMARFPCLDAAQRFWKSPEYQEIKKLRKDSARFEVNVFNELPVPEYINW